MTTLDNLRRSAKRWLRALRAGDVDARVRFERACPGAAATPGLRDVQHAIARERGYESWKAMTAAAGDGPLSADLDRFAHLAEDLALAFDTGDPAALQRLSDHYGRAITWDDVKAMIWKRVRTVREAKGRAGSFPVVDARDLLARDAGFASWDELARAHQQGVAPPAAPYVVDAKNNRVSPRRALRAADWDVIVSAMKERGITALDAGDQMTDAAMEQISRLEHVTSLHIGGSPQLTDAGLRCLERMPQIEELDLGNYPGGAITDRGLEVLRELRGLRRFHMPWQRGITDAGVAHLAACDRLEIVNLLGTQTGDGAIRALTGKPLLRRLTTGRQVTDAGVALLPQLPAFNTWPGGDLEYSLMSAEAGPTHLVLDGPFTNRSLDALVTLDGLFGLSFFWHVSELTSDGLAPLRSMSHLGFVGCQGHLCDDEAMRHIAAVPGLRMLMAQGTVASDEGFIALSRSPTLEYLWGRECPHLTGVGFRALADLPALRGIAVSCKAVDDEALAMLPRFPALRQLMPMDVSDEGFRHVGRCEHLDGLWCMYCRDTTDRATAYLTGLSRLKTYYAGATQITDRSLELLGCVASLERVQLYECRGVTDAGLRFLATLPRLREITLDGLPHVTLAGTALFPAGVRVNYSI